MLQQTGYCNGLQKLVVSLVSDGSVLIVILGHCRFVFFQYIRTLIIMFCCSAWVSG